MFRSLVLLCALSLPAAAQDCASLAAQAGLAEGLPDGLLPAIAMVESGHADGQGGRAPWPWTLNQGGKSHYLETKDEALSILQDILASGTTNVDLGCMQLNWRWHAKAFSGPEEMLDPVANTTYAARFLKELHHQLGSWELATAAYHSTDPERGRGYLARVAAAQKSVAEGDGAVLLAAVPLRLEGLLAVGDGPLFRTAVTQAALFLRDEVIAKASEPPARRAPEPDLPVLREAMVAAPVTRDSVGRRLNGRWDELEQMRDYFAQIP